MVRNETTSSLGARIIGDEREEVVLANSTQTLLTRFVSNGTMVKDLLSNDNNPKLFNYQSTHKKNENSWSLSNFKVNDSEYEVKYISERTYQQHKYELHKACFKGDLEAVKRICTRESSNINLNLKNKLGLTALDCAVEGKRKDIVRYLLEDVRWNINTGGADKRSSLNFAIQISNFSAAEDILNSHKFIDLNIVDDLGNNVFHTILDKYYNQTNEKLSKILEMLFEKMSYWHQYLFTQLNNDLFTPLHIAVRSRNKQAVDEFLTLSKEYRFFTEKIVKIPAGFDELPLIHYFGLMLKGYQSDYILSRHPEINIFERDPKHISAQFFEYFSNNNFDNHRRWFLFKHQKRIFHEKFQNKILRSYKKIIKAERDFSKMVCGKRLESGYHTYTDVLK